MNRAIAEANGEWIAVLDADDWYAHDRLSRLVNAADAHNVPLAADNQYFWDEDAGTIVRTAFPQEYGQTSLTTKAFVGRNNPFSHFDYACSSR